MPVRTVIHLNVADFAVAVERLLEPRLRRRPLIVAPAGTARAVVYDMSEEAYCQGVRKGMFLGRALRQCRDAAVTPPRPDRYEQAMAALFKHARPYSPLIEITDHRGHLFMDATGTGRLFGPPQDVARRIRNAIRADLGIDPIWTVAANKLVAKVASRLVKPAGDYIVPPGEEAGFLAPLPIQLIPGIEEFEQQRLKEFNLRRAGEVAVLDPRQLEILLGRPHPFLLAAVRGIDPSPVLPAGRRPPSIRLDHDFDDDTNDPAVVESGLHRLVEQAGLCLRNRRLACRRIGLVLEYSDDRCSTRRNPVQPPAAADYPLFVTARKTLAHIWLRRVRVRRISLICDRLSPPSRQLELFDDPTAENRRQQALQAALDRIRERFGFQSLCLGRTLARPAAGRSGNTAP
ncbi:MAG: DNA polymerase Y family protein [Thermodesulfobacteriota bacterium]